MACFSNADMHHNVSLLFYLEFLQKLVYKATQTAIKHQIITITKQRSNSKVAYF